MAKRASKVVQTSEETQYATVCGAMFGTLNEGQERIEKKTNENTQVLGRVRERVFDGFGTRIAAVEKDMKQFRIDNSTDHKEIKGALKSLAIVVGTGLFILIAAMIANIWVDRTLDVTEVKKQLAPIVREVENMLEEQKNATLNNQGP